MNFDDFCAKFLEWTEKEIEAKKLDGFPVCPYARKARLQDKIQFLDCRENIQALRDFDKEQYEIGIAWCGDDESVLKSAEQYGEFLAEMNPDLLYFTSTPQSGAFARNFTNCIFVQLKQDILDKRDYLLTTKYYDSWSPDYFKSITGKDKD